MLTSRLWDLEKINQKKKGNEKMKVIEGKMIDKKKKTERKN